MHAKFERGALSLIGVAIFSSLLACVAIATLYSWRYERNLFAEGWAKLGSVFQQAQRTTGVAGVSIGVAAPAVYKCTVNGKLLYSNVACDTKSADSKKVDLQDTSGFEAPKKPVVEAAEGNAPPSLQDKMIEKATSGR